MGLRKRKRSSFWMIQSQKVKSWAWISRWSWYSQCPGRWALVAGFLHKEPATNAHRPGHCEYHDHLLIQAQDFTFCDCIIQNEDRFLFLSPIGVDSADHFPGNPLRIVNRCVG